MRKAVACLLILGALGWAALRVAATPPAATSTTTVATTVVSNNGHTALKPGTVIGVGTCANSGCHGAKEEIGKPWKSAYTAWINKDPHRRAFAVLYSERSVRIVEALMKHEPQPAGESESDAYLAYLRKNCTVCHSTAQEEVQDYSGAVAIDYTFREGVSCESCHGAASGWLEPHQNDKAWKEKTIAQMTELGFIEHANLQVRAEVCVRCHVGSAEANVDHDLIAAGHPRLNFEFYYYMNKYAVLSGHWDVESDRNSHENYFAQLWAIGQLTSAQSALEISKTRAEENGKQVWPEFSEYNCFACHHDLEDTIPSTSRPPWNTWYFVQDWFVSRAIQPAEMAAPPINQRLSGFVSRGEHQQILDDVSDKFAAGLKQLPDTAPNLLLRAVKTKPRHNWDEVGQWYLALWAFYDQMGGDANGELATLKTKLAELGQLLDYPFGRPDQKTGLKDLPELINEIINEVNSVASNPT